VPPPLSCRPRAATALLIEASESSAGRQDRALACSLHVNRWEGQGATGWAAQALGQVVAQHGEPFFSFLLFIWKFSFISNLNQIQIRNLGKNICI
jgi:hypothetical protein